MVLTSDKNDPDRFRITNLKQYVHQLHLTITTNRNFFETIVCTSEMEVKTVKTLFHI